MLVLSNRILILKNKINIFINEFPKILVPVIHIKINHKLLLSKFIKGNQFLIIIKAKTFKNIYYKTLTLGITAEYNAFENYVI